MTKIGIAGAAGRMGRTLVEACRQEAGRLQLAAALDRPGNPTLGRDAGELAGVGTLGVPIGADIAAAVQACDVLIDFTVPEATMAHLAACRENGRRLVIGTTGFGAARWTITRRMRDIAIVMAPT